MAEKLAFLLMLSGKNAKAFPVVSAQLRNWARSKAYDVAQQQSCQNFESCLSYRKNGAQNGHCLPKIRFFPISFFSGN